MGNPTGDGEYGKYDYKHDCPIPLSGCRYPRCGCAVDDMELSHKELKSIERIEEYTDG